MTEMDLPNGSDPAQNDYLMLSNQILIYIPPNTDSFYILTQFVQDYPESPKTFEQNYICWLVGTMQTNILQSVKNLKQEGYDTLDNSPEFLALEALLYVRIDYHDRSMSLCRG